MGWMSEWGLFNCKHASLRCFEQLHPLATHLRHELCSLICLSHLYFFQNLWQTLVIMNLVKMVVHAIHLVANSLAHVLIIGLD